MCMKSGAIEATGHKVLAIPGCKEGKLTAGQVRKLVEDHYNDETQEHMVQPKMVYISHPTELGTLYTKAELEAISAVCREKNLFLYVDGARPGLRHHRAWHRCDHGRSGPSVPCLLYRRQPRWERSSGRPW